MPQRLTHIPLADLYRNVPGDASDPDHPDWDYRLDRVKEAVSLGELFWRDFVEHQGCVIPAGSEGSFPGFWEQTGGDRRAVEAVLSHVHIHDLFPADDLSEEQAVYIGRLLREMWAVKLAHDFPDRRFVVVFNEPEDQAHPDEDLQVWFYQEPDP